MTNIKKEVLKVVVAESRTLDWKLSDIEKAIDLTQQKMIKEFKEMIDKKIKVCDYNIKINKGFTQWTYRKIELEELKSQVEKGKKLGQ